jgi:hypothetical protein
MPDFTYDYFALDGIDIPSWHSGFFWPVAREETNQLNLDLTAAYCRLLESLDDQFASDCCVIGILAPVHFVKAVNHYVAVERLRRLGFAIRHSSRLALVPQFMRPGGPMRFPPDLLPAAPDSGLIKRKAKQFAYSLYYNRFKASKVLDHFDFSRCVLAFPSDNVIFRPHTRRHPDWVRHLSPEEWHGATGEPPAGASAIFKGVAGDFTAFAKGYAEDVLGVALPPALCRALTLYAEETLCGIARGYAGLRDLMDRLRPRRLLTPTAGNPFTRAASLAARAAGAHVTGFPHGYYICHYSSPRPAFHELATVDSFMAYTPGSVPLMQRNLAINPPPRGNRVTIEHENSPVLRDRFDLWRDKPRPDRIKTVMVLELSLMSEWAGYHCAESMVNYHFYYSVCRTLSEAGYEVIFKKRPKGPQWDGVNILKDIPGLRVETRPLETPGVIERADAVMVQYAMSSTLFWSMCTNKTVIYVDSGWEPWFSDVYRKMIRRCRVLPCAYDEANRPVYSRETLLELLGRPPERPDASFIEAYLSPGPGQNST